MAVYTLPKPKGSRKENRFAFRTDEGGKVYTVPFVQYLSGEGAEWIEKAIAEGYNEVQMTRGLLKIECPAATDAVRKMTNDQVSALSKAWANASTVTPGESQGSESS